MDREFDFTQVPPEKLLARITDAVSAGVHPKAQGPVVIRIKLPGGKEIHGSYYHAASEQELDVVNHKSAILCDDQTVEFFVRCLRYHGRPFVTETGSDDQVCTLRWTIV